MQRGDRRLSRFSKSYKCVALPALVILGLVLTSCSFSSERIVTFSGRVVTVSDSGNIDSVAVDLADTPGYIVYDKQTDGVFDDTVVFFGSEDGLFSGVLQYDVRANITASRLRKHVQMTFPMLNIDTFLAIDVYRSGSETPEGANEWPPIVVQLQK